jgi:hypothetical protein
MKPSDNPAVGSIILVRKMSVLLISFQISRPQSSNFYCAPPSSCCMSLLFLCKVSFLQCAVSYTILLTRNNSTFVKDAVRVFRLDVIYAKWEAQSVPCSDNG